MGKLPAKVQKAIKSAVYAKADAHGYMNKDRVQNGAFMDRLIADPEVGQILLHHMSRSSLKTYIKDAVLNRYAKDKTKQELSHDPSKILAEVYNCGVLLIENASSGRLSLFSRNDGGGLVLLSAGTLLKWETSLRKALEFVSKSPGLPPADQELSLFLLLASRGQYMSESDRAALTKSLSLIGVKYAVIGAQPHSQSASI